jgi:hypothetical protein
MEQILSNQLNSISTDISYITMPQLFHKSYLSTEIPKSSTFQFIIDEINCTCSERGRTIQVIKFNTIGYTYFFAPAVEALNITRGAIKSRAEKQLSTKAMNFSTRADSPEALTFSANINHNGSECAAKNNFAEFHPSQSVSRVCLVHCLDCELAYGNNKFCSRLAPGFCMCVCGDLFSPTVLFIAKCVCFGKKVSVFCERAYQRVNRVK